MKTQKSKIQWTETKGAEAKPKISAEENVWADSTTTTMVQKRSLYKLQKAKSFCQRLQNAET